MKGAGLFVVKSAVFSAIFLTMSVLILDAFNSFRDPGASSETGVAVAEESSDGLTEKYWAQAEEADKLLEMSRRQHADATAQLKKQEELLARWQKVIEHWEKTQR